MVMRPDLEPDITTEGTEESVPNEMSLGSLRRFVPYNEYQTSRETGIALPDSEYDTSQYHSSWGSLPGLSSTDVLSRSNVGKPKSKLATRNLSSNLLLKEQRSERSLP